MNRTAFKIAASSAIAAMTMVGISSPSDAMRRFGPVRADSRTDRQAAQFYDQASRALLQGQLAQAVTLMEQAVALSPRDAGYRILLADAYLKSGRFDSARATYADAVELDPSNVRANLSVALIQIAQGHPAAAVGILDTIADRAPAGDVGLAYALAGQADRAVQILESAARSPMATPRTRQNLALAYAFAGDWRRARAIAAQDVSPADIDARMAEWAVLARPGAASAQVATLLGVAPGEDAGQPARIALAPSAPAMADAADTAADRSFAQAAPAAAPGPSHAQFAPARAAAAPVVLAAADEGPAEAPAFWVPPENYQEEAIAEGVAPEPTPAPHPRRIRVASASRAPQPAVESFATPAMSSDEGLAPDEAPLQPVFQAPARPAPAPARRHAVAPIAAAPRAPAVPRRAAFIRALATAPLPRAVLGGAPVHSGNAPVVVQLGAFSNEANAERAWLQVSARYGLQGRRPLTTTYNDGRRILHRVSVSGFASAADAQRLCGQIRGSGGVCFVRGAAGDASIRWAARYADPRRRNV